MGRSNKEIKKTKTNILYFLPFLFMKKVDSGCNNPNCTCENCTCNPCTCGNTGTGCFGTKSKSCCHGNFWFWAIIRIAIVVGLIV